VVYLQHGLADSSDTWIVNEEHLSPAFQLANLGYDVWLGNSRGNRYSTKTLSPSVLDFWSFSFHDMAMFDLPAAFRYISSKTNKKIHYIGHSQGTLIMFIALTQQIKDIEENLLTFNAFGPVAYLNHQKSALMNDLSKTDITHIFLVRKFLFRQAM
jgi:gastric triacylglycerol lipase